MKTLDELVLGVPNPAKEGEDAVNEIIASARIMQDLLMSEGWKEFERLLLARQGAHVQALMRPISDTAGIYVQESNKGAIHALAWASGLPNAIISLSKDLVQSRKAGNGKETKHAPLAP